jgi:RNA-directed DNA polymerase
MHENRETSVAPDAVTGRSGKAMGRTPDVYAAEESDFGVVPMNQPNKSGKPQAEVGEGRPGIKGTSRNPARNRHGAEQACPTG